MTAAATAATAMTVFSLLFFLVLLQKAWKRTVIHTTDCILYISMSHQFNVVRLISRLKYFLYHERFIVCVCEFNRSHHILVLIVSKLCADKTNNNAHRSNWIFNIRSENKAATVITATTKKFQFIMIYVVYGFNVHIEST